MRRHDLERGPRMFTVTMSGKELYGLLSLLEHLAVSEESYLRVRECVLYSERIRQQVTEQGWGRDLPQLGEPQQG